MSPASYSICVCAGTQLASVEPAAAGPVDYEAGWVAPALFDLQINGCLGRAFSSDRLTIADIAEVAQTLRRHGVGRILSDAGDEFLRGPASWLHDAGAGLRRGCGPCSLSAGVPSRGTVHQSGGWAARRHARAIHPQSRRGRIPARLQEAAGGRIRLVTLAPEMPGAWRSSRCWRAQGVVVAIGHTAASGPQIRDAVACGGSVVDASRQRRPCRAAAARQLPVGATRQRRSVGECDRRWLSSAAGRCCAAFWPSRRRRGPC